MKLKKKISISLILMIIIYTILTSVITVGNTVIAAGNYISIEEANKMCPGIADLVNSLKSKHENYNFQFYNTGIEWNEAILREYQGHGKSPYNLFSPGTKYSGKWYCPVCGTQKFDNGLCCASMEALKYMMDPRNSITEDSVFQFKSLNKDAAGFNDIARVVVGTFLNNADCVNAILQASETHDVNAFYLVAKLLTEQGTAGTSPLAQGSVLNGVTYYNLFNIGASGNGASTIITNGINYAASKGWTSQAASIIGGAEMIKRTYIGRGQNTCYYQKFNVVNEESGLFSHQYAQSILSAENEGRKFKSYYTVDGNVTGTHTFIIPLYTNMASATPERPSTATKNEMTYETAVVIANGGLKVRSRGDVTSTQIGVISQGSNVKVICRAATANPNDGYYWDWIISDESGVCGYVARRYITKTGSGTNGGDATDTEYVEPVPEPEPTPTPDSQPDITPPDQSESENDGEKILMSGLWLEISPSTTIEELVEKYPNVIITDISGNITTDICTGYNVSIDGGTYVLVKKGDVNGDGGVNIIDAVEMLNHIKEEKVITDENRLEAGKVNGSEEISVVDVVKLLNYIKENVNDILIK